MLLLVGGRFGGRRSGGGLPLVLTLWEWRVVFHADGDPVGSDRGVLVVVDVVVVVLVGGVAYLLD